MTAKAEDVIFWAPPDARGTILKAHFPYVVHKCPTAVIVAQTTREQLDPMAFGSCRYCQEPLP